MSRASNGRRGRPADIECDAVVVGSGAGGSVAALELARAGRSVTVLEEGPRVSTHALAAAGPAESMRRLYRNGGATPILGTPTIAYGEAHAVGGTTVVNGGLLWKPSRTVLDRWATWSGFGSYRAPVIDSRFAEIQQRLGMIVQEHGEGNEDSRLLTRAAESLGWRWQHPQRVVRGCRHRNQCATGCPSGAKQSMALTYLPEAEVLGVRIHPGVRVRRITHDGGVVRGVEATGPDGRGVRYRARTVFLAAGPIGTPVLLRRSGIHRRTAGRHLALHLNLRTIARFPQVVEAERGTMFTAQVQEHAHLGMLIMPSNLTAGGLGAALAGRDPRQVDAFLAARAHLGMYTTQVRMQGTARIAAVVGGAPLLRHGMTRADHHALCLAFRRTAQLLFAAGAVEILPPTGSAAPLRSRAEVEDHCARVRPGDWELVSVHGMASCPMAQPDRGGLCDELGRPHGFGNLHLCDASVLPGAPGVSPQGTIMSFAHEIVGRHLENM
ncbi:GMC family oxidoreductase [Streptomyces hygroscopicus subsp. hygroscopicus]|uniref:GMC family oxidoreductase n=1 Tax=Streptomyces hygroscopicus TaxID=1912 RepID=UPI001C65F7F6|nr:GMC family oxidoreductase [Streptomyces hygroscopicus]MBW8091989.1 GMC family oxidoreductase [Streptomyces hygroscopicus subsp. hygroscopicus]